MSTYLDDYGASDERRERIRKRIAAVVLIIVVVAGSAWFLFRDYREERRVQTFVQLLAQGDYKAAYAMWGCTEQTPCPDYSFEKFIEDWRKGYSDSASVKVGARRSCDAGIIQRIDIGGDEVLLWVSRENGLLSYGPPWFSCDPHYVPPDAEP